MLEPVREVFADAELIGGAVAHNCKDMSNRTQSLLFGSRQPGKNRRLVFVDEHKHREIGRAHV